MYFSNDIKTNYKIKKMLFRALKLIALAFKNNLGIRHFALYEIYF